MFDKNNLPKNSPNPIFQRGLKENVDFIFYQTLKDSGFYHFQNLNAQT
ncbi:hypothetical protein BGP_6410 [Beggiatoa sp. PS]|nr:hypothetical protein BGP_6410 [Beggiatoa sp. PS]